VLYVTSRIGVPGIVLIDVLTFGCALVTLLLVRVPMPPASAESEAHRGKFLEELRYGWAYIVARPGCSG